MQESQLLQLEGRVLGEASNVSASKGYKFLRWRQALEIGNFDSKYAHVYRKRQVILMAIL